MNAHKKQNSKITGRGSDFIVRVKNDDPSSFKGKIEHIKTGQVQYFNDFLEMVLLVQSKLDEQDYPQCDTELRTFCLE
jgi:hypothetical protein